MSQTLIDIMLATKPDYSLENQEKIEYISDTIVDKNIPKSTVIKLLKKMPSSLANIIVISLMLKDIKYSELDEELVKQYVKDYKSTEILENKFAKQFSVTERIFTYDEFVAICIKLNINIIDLKSFKPSNDFGIKIKRDYDYLTQKDSRNKEASFYKHSVSLYFDYLKGKVSDYKKPFTKQ